MSGPKKTHNHQPYPSFALEGKEGYGWWLWVFLGPDTVVFLLDVSCGHEVPEGHYQAGSRGVLVVDRERFGLEAMSWVKDGFISSWLSAGPMCVGISSAWAKDGHNRRRGPWNGCVMIFALLYHLGTKVSHGIDWRSITLARKFLTKTMGGAAKPREYERGRYHGHLLAGRPPAVR